MDTHDLSWANWMCPLPVAPAKSSWLAYPQGSDPCALQKTFLGMTPQGLREDASNMKLQTPGLHEDSMDSEKLTARNSPNRDEMANQMERGSCLSFPPHTSSSQDFRMDRESPSPSTFWPWLPPTVISKELPIHTYPVFPGYPLLLPPSYLFTYAALSSAQCPHLFTLPPDPSYPIVAPPSLLMTINRAGPQITQEKPLLFSSGAFQSARHTLCSQVRDASTLSPGQAGVAAPAKQPGSQAGVVTLPYPLKKKNGKILYECNECGKNFGQLSNLKVHLRVHSGERPFQCALCQKSFTQLAHLQKHHLVHTGERPYQCRTCFKRFSSSSNLKTHLRLHSGTQPFQCNACSSHFTAHVHLKLHHRLQAPRPHSLAHTHIPLPSLTCLAQWRQGPLGLVGASSEKMGWDVDQVKVSSSVSGKSRAASLSSGVQLPECSHKSTSDKPRGVKFQDGPSREQELRKGRSVWERWARSPGGAPAGPGQHLDQVPPEALGSQAAVCSGGRAGGGASLPGRRIRVTLAAKCPTG
ncbi:LOW QUALITY PROTEIN: tissue-resident T-cell transcription regulator protein ZNF683 [Cricetulus griseus]|uniref:LOW QUALITY PROTEIN: tissue-resident T-cell transcription regulator protein ZNF683 n=1 Tax=Cricetulus griseus TaxID=10029 RepID=A0A9J7GPQ0_CRIGR|nr:LOW QUALITY PROTEIN: tissue-resident T-cell transcription regulator protein ZNF683 [Cricetulus griseus]